MPDEVLEESRGAAGLYSLRADARSLPQPELAQPGLAGSIPISRALLGIVRGLSPARICHSARSIEILLTHHSIDFIYNNKFYMENTYAPSGLYPPLLHRRIRRPDHHRR